MLRALLRTNFQLRRAHGKISAVGKTPSLKSPPSFALLDATGRERSFPSGRPAMLCFVKEDCPTCDFSLPLIDGAFRAFGETADIWAIGQEREGNLKLVARHKLGLPMLDDSALRVSYGFEIEIVPTIVLVGADGAELCRLEGFVRDEWRGLFAKLAEIAGKAAPALDWGAYPAWRAGCGSKSLEPQVAQQLEAEASGSRLRARRIELGSAEDPFEFMFERGLTDGLPVIPPTPERVLAMLQGTRRDPQEVVAIVPPNMAPATVEKIAANAVMAGCRPEYLPVVLAALEAVCTPEFNIHGVMATTWGATPVIVVNGPVRHKIGMNMGRMVLGYGNRANATIGRALKLAIRNLGGARPGEVEQTALGSAGKYTTCFAEWEERNPWQPLHVERGFKREQSVVTVFPVESGSRQVWDQTSRNARSLAASLGLGLEACGHPKAHNYEPEVLIVVAPEHAATFGRDGWTKAQVRERIQEVTARPLAKLLPSSECAVGTPPASLGIKEPTAADLARLIPKFRRPQSINIVVAGGEAGKFTAIFAGWYDPAAARSVSRLIEEV